MFRGGSGIWRIISTTLYARISIIVVFFFFVKLFFSCDPPDPIDMVYSAIKLEVRDNSGHVYSRYYSDTIYSDAVSIELSLADSTNYYASNTLKAATLFSFEPVSAFSPNISYQPVHLVEDIRVFTVFDIDASYQAGDDITDSILYSTDDMFSMYVEREKAISYFNGLQWRPRCSVLMVLKSSVKNTKARFRVEVSFDDGSRLIETTGLYTIIPSNL